MVWLIVLLASLRDNLSVWRLLERKLLSLWLGEFLSCVLVDKVAEVVSLLTLPLAWAALHLAELNLAVTLVIAVVPLEDILHAGSFLVILCLLSSKLRLKLWQILLDQVKLDNMLSLDVGLIESCCRLL